MGLARFFNEAKADGVTERLEGGVILGTIDYLAPEQAIESSAADIRADIYSLGITLYTLIVGAPPFTGSTTQKIMKIQVKVPEPLSTVRKDVPTGLGAVVGG